MTSFGRTFWSSLGLILGFAMALLTAVAVLLLGVVIFTDYSWKELLRGIANYSGSLGTTFVAFCALFVAIFTLDQKRKSDDRAAFYERAQWAVDMTISKDEARQSVGWLFLPSLLESALKDSEDFHFGQAVQDYSDRYSPQGQYPGAITPDT